MKKLSPWIAAFFTLALSACGDDKGGGAPAPIVKKTAAAVKDTGPKLPTYVYAYNPTARRDPFRSPMGDYVVQASANKACSEPLCQYDLDQLTLVAVVTGDADPIAMVEDPQGQGFLIHRNTRVGKQGGKVTQILRDSLTVTELFVGPDGKTSPNTLNLALKADKDPGASAKDLNTGVTYP